MTKEKKTEPTRCTVMLQAMHYHVDSFDYLLFISHRLVDNEIPCLQNNLGPHKLRPKEASNIIKTQ